FGVAGVLEPEAVELDVAGAQLGERGLDLGPAVGLQGQELAFADDLAAGDGEDAHLLPAGSAALDEEAQLFIRRGRDGVVVEVERLPGAGIDPDRAALAS